MADEALTNKEESREALAFVGRLIVIPLITGALISRAITEPVLSFSLQVWGCLALGVFLRKGLFLICQGRHRLVLPDDMAKLQLQYVQWGLALYLGPLPVALGSAQAQC